MKAEVLHLTDEGTPGIEGCTVIRKEWTDGNPMLFKMRHLSDLTGDVLVLDTDVIVQADLSGVFSIPFKVALTERDGPIYDSSGKDVTRAMPYNCGVMWYRDRGFFADCLEWCKDKPVGWYADQLAVAALARKWRALRLHCDDFNYTPASKDEDVSHRLAVHYKGNRKEWME
jgi:lipopolysaccharide biosynthesis glycosyltransferase